MEREANVFAAEFLSPISLAERYRTSGEISSVFQISAEAGAFVLDDIRQAAILRRFQDARGIPASNGSGQIDLLADRVSMVVESISKVVQYTNRKRAVEVEPLYRSLLGAAIGSVSAGHLLFTAHESVRRTGQDSSHKVASCLAAAILCVQPIRSRNRPDDPSHEVILANQYCALHAAASILKIPLDDIDRRLLRRLYRASVRSFQCSYLRPHMAAVAASIKTPSTIPDLARLSSYDEYNKFYDITWEEIDALENLMNLFELLEAAYSRSNSKRIA